MVSCSTSAQVQTIDTGAGNCLFSSLSDQLYGDASKHLEVRGKIVEHMRTWRPIFEGYVHVDDVQSRRTTRSATNAATAASTQDSVDRFEEYLTKMARPTSYGGEPELVAFCQAYDQDVTVHLPKIRDFDKDLIFYTNEYRNDKSSRTSLHICYGGEDTLPHYDSARIRNEPEEVTDPETQTSLTNGKPDTGTTSDVTSTDKPVATSDDVGGTSAPSARAIRSERSELSQDLIHDFLQKSRRDVEGVLSRQARSPSVSSSHRSSSSKRSLDDEGDNPRRKRADRRKSTRKRTDMALVSFEDDLNTESPSTADTPASTQGTETSSDDADYRPDAPSDDEDVVLDHKRRIIKPASRKFASNAPLKQPIKIAERPRPSSLRA
jgi:hypothetical protein